MLKADAQEGGGGPRLPRLLFSVAYWFLAVALMVFGALTGFSIGIPFLTVGAALVALYHFRHRRQIFWPVLAGLVLFWVGFVAAAPFQCAMSQSVTFGPGGTSGSITQMNFECVSLLGAIYPGELAGRGMWLALFTGIGTASAGGGVTYLLAAWRRKP